MVLNYIFSLFAYYSIYTDYGGWCNDTLTCFVYNVDAAFKFDGGIGGGIDAPPLPNGGENTSKFFTRLVYDNLYNIILMIVMISIISGIIIDKFAEMRDEQNEQDEDIENVCFVCHIERDEIDKASGE